MKSALARSGDLRLLVLLKTFSLSLGLGIICCSAMLFIFAAVLSQIDIPGAMITVFAMISVCFGTLVFSFCMCKMIRKRAIIVGIFCGLLIYAVIFLIGLFLPANYMEPFHFMRLLAVLISSIIGSVWSVNTKKRK